MCAFVCMWVPVHMDASACEGQRTEAFSQVMLTLFQTVSLIDLELTCNQLEPCRDKPLFTSSALGCKQTFHLGLKIQLRSLCFKASILQTELSSQFWVLLF